MTGATELPFTISVLVSDVTEMGCELLASALNSSDNGTQVVATAVTAKDLVQAVVRHKPQVALIGLALQDDPLGGFTALREIYAQAPEVPCVVLMDTATPELVLEALRCGAKGVFLRRHGPIGMLRRCIQVISEGQIWISSSDLFYLIDYLRKTTSISFLDAKGRDLLTPRENEVATLAATGLTNREIAREMNLSENTVKNYLLRIFDKLGLSSRGELIIYVCNHKNL